MNVVITNYGKLIVINPDSTDERISRTIKAQYYKNGIDNIFRQGTFGCTGVIVKKK